MMPIRLIVASSLVSDLFQSGSTQGEETLAARCSSSAVPFGRDRIFQHRLRDFLTMTVEDFRETFAKSPIKRIKRDRFLRNVCVALGNTGSPDDLPLLKEAAIKECELVAKHARWAIAQIEAR